jgi:c(7)-type cytochrome triheme protein
MTARGTRWALALAAALTGGAALAGGPLYRLPTDYAFPRGESSPGPVLFSHRSHVDEKKPSCVTCHPRVFRITETGRTATREVIKHERMEAGGACGTCHGKTAFGFETCENCHK